ncbi:hypothetical protein [Thermosulfuriphilus sp.]
MFRPEKLVRISIRVPEEYISSATAYLARIRLLHLIRVEKTPLGPLGYVGEIDPGLWEDYQNIVEEINSLIKELEISSSPPVLKEVIVPEKEIFRLQEELAFIQKEALGAISQKKNLKRSRDGRKVGAG